MCGHFDGIVQERCNSVANTLELRLSCTKPSMWSLTLPSCPRFQSAPLLLPSPKWPPIPKPDSSKQARQPEGEFNNASLLPQAPYIMYWHANMKGIEALDYDYTGCPHTLCETWCDCVLCEHRQWKTVIKYKDEKPIVDTIPGQPLKPQAKSTDLCHKIQAIRFNDHILINSLSGGNSILSI